MEDSAMSEIRIAQPEDKETVQRIYHAVVGPHADQDEARWDRKYIKAAWSSPRLKAGISASVALTYMPRNK